MPGPTPARGKACAPGKRGPKTALHVEQLYVWCSLYHGSCEGIILTAETTPVSLVRPIAIGHFTFDIGAVSIEVDGVASWILFFL